jgi:hypothetical protein
VARGFGLVRIARIRWRRHHNGTHQLAVRAFVRTTLVILPAGDPAVAVPTPISAIIGTKILEQNDIVLFYPIIQSIHPAPTGNSRLPPMLSFSLCGGRASYWWAAPVPDGTDKGLLPFRGERLVDRIARQVLTAAGSVTLVGAPREVYRHRLQGDPRPHSRLRSVGRRTRRPVGNARRVEPHRGLRYAAIGRWIPGRPSRPGRTETCECLVPVRLPARSNRCAPPGTVRPWPKWRPVSGTESAA